MLPPKNGKPITFKPTPETRSLIEKYADAKGVTLSDYVRKAVEIQIGREIQNEAFDGIYKKGCSGCGCEDGNHAQECNVYYNAGYGKRLVDSTHNTKEQLKTNMVKSFNKGGK